MNAEPRWVNLAISRLLRWGVTMSITIVLAGLVVTFLHHPEYIRSRAALGQLTAHAIVPHTLRDVAAGLRSGHGQAIIAAGLLLLIATPVARVALSIIVFAVERDALYVVITSAVLLRLLFSFAAGAAG